MGPARADRRHTRSGPRDADRYVRVRASRPPWLSGQRYSCPACRCKHATFSNIQRGARIIDQEGSMLTSDLASRFMQVALGHVTREFPNKLDHLLTGPGDLTSPRALHPIFFGSFD